MKPSARRFLGLGVVLLVMGAAVVLRPEEPSHAGKPLTFWLHFISGSTRQQQAEAEAAVRGMGARAVPALVRRIVAKDPWWKRTLASLPQAQSLFKLNFRPTNFQSREATIARSQAAIALSKLGPDAAVAQPKLLRALQDSDPGVRASAAMALGMMESPAEIKVSALMAHLNDQDGIVSNAVAEALGYCGPAAMPALMAALRRENPAVEWGALRAIGAIMQRNAVQRNAVQRPLNLPTILPDGAPGFAIDEVFPSTNGVTIGEALALFVVRLKSPQAEVRELTAMLLAEFGSEGRPVIPALIAARSDGDEEVRQSVRIALDRIGYTDPNASQNPNLTFKFPDSSPIGVRLYKESEPLGIGYSVQPTDLSPTPANSLSVPAIPKR